MGKKVVAVNTYAEATPEGVFLRPARPFEPTQPDEVFGSLAYVGVPRTLEDMEAGIAAKARRRHAGG